MSTRSCGSEWEALSSVTTITVRGQDVVACGSTKVTGDSAMPGLGVVRLESLRNL